MLCVGGSGIIRQNTTNMLQDTGNLGTGGTFPERQGRAHAACTPTRSSAPFPTLPSPEQAHSPAFPSSQHTPVWAAPGPAHRGRRLTCQPGARSRCLPLPVCAYLDLWPPGPLGQPTTPTSREFLQLGHSSPLLQVSPSRGPPPQRPGEPHSDPTGQLISGSLP